MDATLSVSRGGGTPKIMHPQARFFADPPTPTTESAQLTAWDGQLYLVLGDELGDGRWQLRLWWKAVRDSDLGGGALIALGGMLALIGRVGRGWLRRPGAGARRQLGGGGMKRKWLLWLPLGAYVIFLALPRLAQAPDEQQGHHVPDDRQAHSGHGHARRLLDQSAALHRQARRRQAALVNIFASWCVPCRREAPQLAALQQRGVVIDGVAIRDARPDVDRFLAHYGNPYDRIGLDARLDMQILSRLLGRAGDLCRRWQGHHPLPALGADHAAGHGPDPAEAARGLDMRRALLPALGGLLMLSGIAMAQTALPPAPYANTPARGFRTGSQGGSADGDDPLP